MTAATSTCVDVNAFEPHAARAIELQVGKARIAVGVALIDRIVETQCTRLPLTHPLVHGIGFDAGRPLVCVFLGRKTEVLRLPMVTAVILAVAGTVAWALCADQILGVVPVVERSTTGDARLPRWLTRVRTSDGRVLAWLDPNLMVLDIGGAHPS